MTSRLATKKYQKTEKTRTELAELMHNIESLVHVELNEVIVSTSVKVTELQFDKEEEERLLNRAVERALRRKRWCFWRSSTRFEK